MTSYYVTNTALMEQKRQALKANSKMEPHLKKEKATKWRSCNQPQTKVQEADILHTISHSFLHNHVNYKREMFVSDQACSIIITAM